MLNDAESFRIQADRAGQRIGMDKDGMAARAGLVRHWPDGPAAVMDVANGALAQRPARRAVIQAVQNHLAAPALTPGKRVGRRRRG